MTESVCQIEFTFLSGFGRGLFYNAVVAGGDHKLTVQDEAPFPIGKFWNWVAISLWRKAVLFSAAFFICAEGGSFLSPRGDVPVSFWLPAGLYLAALLLTPPREWLWLALAAFLANLAFDFFHGTPFLVILAFFCANTVQAFVGAWLVRRFVAEKITLATLKEYSGLVFFAAVLSTVLGAFIGATTVVHSGFSHSFARSWRIWWGSNAMAVLLLTPFILTWLSPLDRSRKIFGSRRKEVEAILLVLGLIAYIWHLLIFQNGVMSLNKSLAIPLLLWAGLRFGTRGATAISLSLALPVAFFTTQFSIGLTPTQAASRDFVFVMQMVMAMASLVALVPAIVLGERDRTLARLRESEERFRHLTQAAFEGVCVSEQGRILDVNNQFATLFGYPREELIGREIVTLIAPEWRERIAERLRKSEEGLIEHHLLRKDGTTVEAEAQSRTMSWGTRRVRVTAVRDISGRKRAEQALRESEEKFSKAFRTSPDVMSITDFATGCYLEVNDAHEAIFGFKREDVLGRSPIELGILEDSTVREKMLKELEAHGSVRGREIQTRTRDGKVLTLLHSAELIDLGGRRCVLRVSHDITDRKRAEADRERAINHEQQMRLEYTLQLIASQEAERARIAAELHDSLGQNLSIIKNSAQLALLQKRIPRAVREQLDGIGDMASKTIAEIRQISHDLHPPQLDHLGLTRALDALVESAGAASGIIFKKRLDTVDDAFSRDAATNLYRIVQEGLNNILKYSRAKTARVILERDLREVLLKIEDDGCGFDIGKPVNSGKGMGLKNIAERTRMLGGKLKLDSAPGKGARMEITIPIAVEPE